MKPAILVSSSFTAEPLQLPLQRWLDLLHLDADLRFTGFNQVLQQALDPSSESSQNRSGANVFLIRLEDLAGAESNVSRAASELSAAFAALSAQSPARQLIVFCPSANRSEEVRRIELDLVRQLTALANVTALSAEEWIALYPVTELLDSESDKSAKIPFTPFGYTALATLIARRISVAYRPPAKVLVLDADNTLWGGVCGEESSADLNLEGGYRALREFALAKRREGILLCLCSKNQPADVERVFYECAVDLGLNRDQFTGWKVSWSPKSQSIRELATELNLGLDSFVFLDDNPAEIGEVRGNCPGVLALVLPSQPSEFETFLSHLWPLDTNGATAADASRAEFYRQESERRELRKSTQSFADFLRGLNLNVVIAPCADEDLPRVAQLTKRTNQFNANPLRLSEGELQARLDQEHVCLSVHVSDRFGDYGLVGAMLYNPTASSNLEVELFLLSCRAMGKGVERAMVIALGERAVSLARESIRFHFTETDRNEPCRRFLRSIHAEPGEGSFQISAQTAAELAPLPDENANVETEETQSSAPKAEASVPLFDAVLAHRIATELSDPVRFHTELCVERRPRPELAEAFVRPETPLQERLATLWKEVLGLEQVGLHDPFSALGGTSLQLVRLHAGLRRDFGLDLELAELFELPTIAAQAARAVGTTTRQVLELTEPMSACALEPDDQSVAIIGVALRVPGASSPEAFWSNLAAGVESITRFTKDEVENPQDFDLPNYVAAKGMIEGVDLFDAAFFGILPKEAQMIDPQQRIFLELAWEAMERAGYTPETHRQRIGIWAGAYFDTYLLANLCTNRDFLAELIPTVQVGSLQTELGNDKDHLATRVAYKMNLRGPAMTLQTACSTSMVAIIQACRAIRSGLCDMALAGGVTVTLPLKRGYLYREQGMLSGDGHCRAFDAKATGTVFSNGAGVVMLKRLRDAIRDRDHIHAVIRGTGLNNDGGVKHSYTAPSVEGQSEAIRMAHRDAGISADTIGYVEAHGTGTPLGDPIEVSALTKAFRASGVTENGYCALGSLKTNIGHLDVASGVCGLIKTALSLENGLLPPVVHFERPNPKIDFANSPFRVNAAPTPWHQGLQGQPRRAGVSAFGVGGTNAHVVVEEAPVVSSSPSPRPNQLFLVSARTPEALAAATANLASFAAQPGSVELADAAWTLAIGRKPFRCRKAISAPTFAALAEALSNNTGVSGIADRSNPPVHFLFPGQGAQHVNMGRVFYDSEPRFRRLIDHCSTVLKPHLGVALSEVLYPAEGADLQAAAERLKSTVLAQPAIFVVEYALADLWRHWGVTPVAMIGHSVGEFVAACLAGVFDLDSGLRLLATRGRLMGDLPGGGMLSIRLPEADLLERLPSSLDLAAVNGPSLCVVAGPRDELEAFRATLEASGVGAQPLHTSHAFHSRMMDPVVERFAQAFQEIELRAPQIPILSTVTGEWLTAAETTNPYYWAKHLREPVRFHRSVVTLGAEKPEQLFVEIGPGQTLTGLVRQSLDRKAGHVAVSTCRHVKEPGCDQANLFESLGKLWSLGVAINWEAFYGAEERKRVILPTYPFERKRHWVEASPLWDAPVAAPALPPALAPELPVSEAVPASLSFPVVMTPSQPESRLTALAEAVRSVLTDLSGIPAEDLASEASFLEQGFDSLLLTQLSKALQDEFKVEITLRSLMGDLSSIDAMVAYLDAKLPSDRFRPEPATPVTPPPSLAPQAAPAMSAPTPAPMLSAAAVPTPPAMPVALNGTIESVIAQQLELMRQQIALLQGGAAALPATPAPAAAPVPTTSAPAIPAPSSPSAPAAPSTKVASTGSSAPTTSINRSLDGSLTDRQRNHLDQLIANYVAKTRTSKELTAKYRQWYADPRTVSGFNRRWKEMVYQIAVQKSKGSRLIDVDGNEYIDLLNGFGPNFLGHAPEFITEALRAQLDCGFEVGPQSVTAMEAAQLFCEVTGNERASFVNTGSEAVQAAMRLSRTVTGRDKVVVFARDYHGNFDEMLVKGVGNGAELRSMPVAPGIPRRAVEDVIVLPYGTEEALQVIRARAHELAAVIVEPIQSRRPEFQPREFIHEVRNITRQSGTVFVFDEVITGFRTGPRGAQGYYGIEADIATYGKVVGGGMPLGVVAGKAQFMDTFDGGMWNYGDDSFPEKGVTFFAGTFVRHPLTMAATRAVLLHLKEKGPEFWQGIRDRANRLAQSVDKMFVETGAPLRMPNFGSQMFVRAAEDHPYANLLFFHLRHKGVFLLEGFPTYMTAAHTDEEIDYVIRAFTESVAELQDAGFFQPATGTSPLYLNGAGLSGPQRLLTANSTSVPSVVQAAPKPYPLTESLAEVWLASQIGGDASLCFNEIMLIDLHGEVKVPALRQALQDIAARHDSLRMAFRSDAEGFEVLPQVTIELAEVNLSAVAPDSRQAEFEQVLQEQRATPFDLTSGPLFRGVLVQLDREESTLILAAHHVACDGWSFKILIEETGQFYNARVQGTTPNLTPAPSYADYVVEAAGLEAKSEATREEAYWLSQFAEPVAPLNLPLDFPAAQDPDFLCGTVAEYLGPDLLRSLKKVAGQSGGTLFSLLLGAYQLLLSRISRQTRFVVWFPVAGQSEHHREDLVGHCVNALPFVTTIPAEGSFGSFVKANQNQLLDVLDHMDFTFGRLIKKLGPDQRPLMEAIFNYERMDGSVEMNGLRTEIREIERGFARNPLLLKTYETPSGLEVRFDFQSALFQASTVREWLETYRAILEGVAAQPHASVAEISAILSDNQWQRIRQWNLTETNYPRDCNLNELFEQTVQRRGGAIAIRSDQGELSYSTFSDMVGRVAYALTESGVAPGQRVGLFMERSPELIASILAVIKAGAAYVPMDPAYPAERTRYIVEDSGIKVVLTESDLLDRLPKEIVKLTVRDALKRGPSNRAPHRNSVGPDSPACVIYTSGSTGQPKGGILSHRNIVRLVRNTNMTEFGDDELILQLTTICFDPSLAEIFGSLMNGGSLVIPPAGQLTVDQIADRIIAHGVTQVFTTPALLHLLIDERIDAFHSLRRIFTGGDVPSPTQVRRILESHPRCAVVNAYGPTENTTITTMHVITASDLDGTGIPIGRPISNTTVWITDANGKPVPPGMPGELLTGGDGVAIGYLNRPELTTERFLADPYRDVSGARLYRTGDLCRFRPDGVIEFLGRIDQQVKIRGFRIELGEIENQLSRHPAVRLCRVLVRGTSPSDKFLVAYVAPVALATPSPTELGDYLRSKLPHFMVPAAFVLMENLPVNPNGKLDIHKLPMPETVVPSKAEELPSLPPSETERTLIELWKQILGVQSLGLDDDFFALGGHSLQGMKLFTRIQKAFGVALPLGRLFRAPTVRQLARLIDEQLGSGSMEETPALYPMTEPLAEVWLASQIGGNASLPFNEVNVLTMSGPLDQPALEGALQDLAARHDALRTVFLANGDGFEVRPVVRIPMRTVDLSPLPADAKEQGIEEAKSRQCLTPFDLAKGPLFRAELLKLGNEEHLLLLNAHHLACDGWSNQIVMRELAELYNARVDGKPASLKPAPSFAAYVLRASATEHAGPEQTFWLGQFAEPVQPLRLPLDFAARPDSDHHCDSVIQQIDPEKLIQLKRLAARSGATLFGLLFGVFQALLHRISRQQRFAVWFPAAGQSGIGHENQVGHCVNVLPLVGTVDPARSFREFLEQTQNGLLDALQHRNYTYGQLIKQSRRENRPTIEAVFNFEKLSDTLEMRGLMTRTREIDRRFASHPLFLKAYETTQGLEFRFDFQTSLFKRDNIREWLDTYSAMLDAFAADPSLQVKDVCAAMTESQANRLRTWNQTEVPFPSNDTLPGLFHITSKSHPNKTAIRFGEQTLSYAELEDMADRICLTLLGAGTKPGARVGIFLDRSPEMVASILGVLKTGATYVPIDPAYPADRTRYIIEDSGIDIVLSQQELFDRLPKENTVISLKQALKRSDSRNHPFPPMQDSDAAACVLYTSGSTGKPKGALIPHRAIVRLVRNTNFTVLDESEVLIQVASVCFDASLYEIFGALVNGGCLVIPPAGHLTVDQIAREIRTKSVTQTFLTSALFEVMVEECLDCFSGLRRLVIGGDIASPAHSAKFAQAHPQCLLVNGYGPTESTTFVTYHVISPEDIQGPRIPIGQPLHNSTVWIVDSFGNLVPPGIPGELLTGGAGVALGYLNRPDLTGERFLADRFSPDSRGRLYRSGDLCRFRADGVIEFLGRFDHQVKIRGFRIEPGEIENLLGRHPGVRQCKIVVRGDGAGDKVLIGYASPIPTAAPTEDELKDYLRSKLPSYMVPSTIVILPELPMNPNGKIDTHALPAPGVVKAAPGESLPPTATESTISELWKQVLGLSAVGLDDDFFAIGGHSLLGMKLFSGIQRIFGVSLPLGKLFRAPTVRQLARLVDADLATKKAVEASSKMIASSHLHPIWEASAPPIPARPTTALVPIQPKGDAHPVFAIHGGDGGILFYGKLSQRLGDDLPFFAFEAPALTAGAQIPEESVEQTAAKYLEELLKVQPRGPFNLCGYSFGGVVAYEIACRLAARGETIAFLGLIDTDNPAAAIRRRSLSERVALSWNDQAQSKSGVLAKVSALSRRVGTGIVDRLCTEAEEALARSLPAAEKIARLRQVQLRKAHERAVEAYIPPRFPGKLTLFRAAIEGDKYEMARDYGWTDLVAELEIITVPGTHLSIFHEENIAGMADAFRDCMSAVTV